MVTYPETKPNSAPTPEPMFHKILLCSDGSDQALAAARYASEIAQKFGSEIVLVHVFNPAVAPVPFVGLPETVMLAEGEASDYAEETLATAEERTGHVLKAANLNFVCRREIGNPVDRILAVAHDENADLIVIGSRGLTTWGSLVLGSVSSGVLHHAHCPVMVVR